jgi:hypothetical protein
LSDANVLIYIENCYPHEDANFYPGSIGEGNEEQADAGDSLQQE